MKKYNQHYVPRSILRNFVKTQAVFCLMKDQDGKIISSSVDYLCAEKSFYSFSLDIEDENTSKTLDYDKQAFDKIDSEIAPVIQKLVEQHNIDVLNDDDRAKLATYVVYQYMRSPAVKNIAVSLTQNDKVARQIQGLNLLDGEYIQRLSEIISNFKLELIRATQGVNFIISDSPVLWSPTAEGIYFPISPDYCLFYQPLDNDSQSSFNLLDSICINQLEFLASVRFNIAKSEDTLQNIWDGAHQSHISNFCQSGTSYWRSILRTFISSLVS
jgi:hypothetical protein